MRYPRLVFALVSSIWILTGCTSTSPVSLNLRLAPVQVIDTSPLPGILTPTVAVLDEHPIALVRETDNTRATLPLATQTATPLPATATATAAPTPMPVVNSPTPEGLSAPEVPIRLIIGAINLDTPVIAMGWSMIERAGQQVSEWDVPDWRAAGWLSTSALVGMSGNTVLEGHQDIAGRVFEDLEYLKEGDEIQVQTASQTHRYIVTLRAIVLEKDQPLEVRHENARWIGPSNDERLTLVTCWPRNNNTHRLILVALPAP